MILSLQIELDGGKGEIRYSRREIQDDETDLKAPKETTILSIILT